MQLMHIASMLCIPFIRNNHFHRIFIYILSYKVYMKIYGCQVHMWHLLIPIPLYSVFICKYVLSSYRHTSWLYQKMNACTVSMYVEIMCFTIIENMYTDWNSKFSSFYHEVEYVVFDSEICFTMFYFAFVVWIGIEW